ncbi:MAG TPA: hypothetical protein VFN68_07235 [Acidimicrobiales bacterium]|nr:hypothetical protein [Acidimicrobiales bacterium]
MGVAEIVGFAVCWVVVATLMLWGVFTERRRGGPPTQTEWQPTHYNRVSQTDWIVVESTPGGTPEVAQSARLIAAALLASRGIDLESLPPEDLRTEVTSTGDGVSTTRVLVRAGAMHASRRRH